MIVFFGCFILSGRNALSGSTCNWGSWDWLSAKIDALGFYERQ